MTLDPRGCGGRSTGGVDCEKQTHCWFGRNNGGNGVRPQISVGNHRKNTLQPLTRGSIYTGGRCLEGAVGAARDQLRGSPHTA